MHVASSVDHLVHAPIILFLFVMWPLTQLAYFDNFQVTQMPDMKEEYDRTPALQWLWEKRLYKMIEHLKVFVQFRYIYKELCVLKEIVDRKHVLDIFILFSMQNEKNCPFIAQ